MNEYCALYGTRKLTQNSCDMNPSLISSILKPELLTNDAQVAQCRKGKESEVKRSAGKAKVRRVQEKERRGRGRANECAK